MTKVETGLLAGRVPYIRGGSGPSEAVVLFGANALFKRLDRTSNPSRYANQVARLLPGHRFTILGYQGSNFEEIVRDMALVIQTPPDVVMGISFGGFVAMRFAAQHPELVKRLVLLVSAHRFSPNGQQMMARQFAALKRGDFRALVRENALLFRRPLYNWLVRVKIQIDGNRLTSEFRDPGAILRDYRQLFGPDFEDQPSYCRRIVCPSIVIGGSADQFFDREGFVETASLIPGAQIQIFEGETHMLPLEKSGGVASAISKFLALF